MSKPKTQSVLVAFAVIAVVFSGVGITAVAATNGMLGEQTFSADSDTEELRTTVNGTANATVSVYGVDSGGNLTELQTNVSMTEVDPNDGYDLYEYAYSDLDPTTYDEYELEVYGDTSLDTTVEFDKLAYTSPGGGIALDGSNTMLYGGGLLVLVVGGFLLFVRTESGNNRGGW